MTDDQFNRLFDLVTKYVNGIQELKQDMSEVKVGIFELKSDVSELKDGQKRIEKQIRLNNAAVNEIAGEQVRIRSIVTDLEKTVV